MCAPRPESFPTGVMNARTLRERGVDESKRRKLLAKGALRVLRRGWYATPSAHPHVAAAVQAGGLLTCQSLVELLTEARVTAPLHASFRTGQRPPRGVSTVHTPVKGAQSERATHVSFVHPCRFLPRFKQLREPQLGNGLDSVWNASLHLMSCAEPLMLEFAFEQMLHDRLLSSAQFQRLQEAATARAGRVLNFVSGLSESYLEVVMRVHMRKAGLFFKQQVWIPGFRIRVDFLIGERLIVEVDGKVVHSTADAFESDRRRDALLTGAGYRVLRFSYSQVMESPEACIATIRSVMARGGHRRG